MPDNPLLANISKRERERLAIHNLARVTDCTRKIAALLDCEFDEAIRRAVAVRDNYSIGENGG